MCMFCAHVDSIFVQQAAVWDRGYDGRSGDLGSSSINLLPVLGQDKERQALSGSFDSQGFSLERLVCLKHILWATNFATYSVLPSCSYPFETDKHGCNRGNGVGNYGVIGQYSCSPPWQKAKFPGRSSQTISTLFQRKIQFSVNIFSWKVSDIHKNENFF